MNRKVALTLSAAAGGLLASALLPAAAALADTGAAADASAAAAVFPDAPGSDAFTIGGVTYDPYLGTTITTDPATEGFNPLTQGTGSPPFFETGSVNDQNFLIFETPSGASAPTELGSASATENVTSLFGITNTGIDFTGSDLAVTGGSTASLPVAGTVIDVTNFGSGFENVYSDIPGAAGAAGTVTDTFVTPFGDYNLSDLFTAFDLSSLDPGAAFGVGADAAGAAADAAGSLDPLSFLGL